MKVQKYYVPMSQLWPLAKIRNTDEHCEPVYLVYDIDKIPKLEVTDLEILQIRSLMNIAVWIRTIQSGGLTNFEAAELFSGFDRDAGMAAFNVGVSLISKFDRYVLEHKIPVYADVWKGTPK